MEAGAAILVLVYLVLVPALSFLFLFKPCFDEMGKCEEEGRKVDELIKDFQRFNRSRHPSSAR